MFPRESIQIRFKQHETRGNPLHRVRVIVSLRYILQCSPKSFHKNMEGTSSGCSLRALTRSLTCCKSCKHNSFLVWTVDFVRKIQERIAKAALEDFPSVASASDVTAVCIRGLSSSRLLQRMTAYSAGMPIGYTFAAETRG